MGFIERLRQEEAAKALRAEQLKTQQAVLETARHQREAHERERRAKRRQQAENFREESGIGIAVAKLGEFLATPTIPVVCTSSYDGLYSSYTKLIGRGSYSRTNYDLPISSKDPDSTYDIAEWDAGSTGVRKKAVGGSVEYFTKKYIAVETCPDGTIIFHAGWLGSTTIGLAKWRVGNKEQLYDKALEKAYRNPGINRYATFHEWQYKG